MSEATGASTTHERSDAELLAAHVAGDADAFGRLFARHRDRLWAVALRTCGDPEVAADGLQDAVVAAFRRAGTFRGESAVTTWLHRVVVNACLDRLRADTVRRAEPLPEHLEPGELPGAGGRLVGGGAVSAGPEDSAVAGERRARVLAALEQLTPEQRAAVVLVDMEGYPVSEVAAILECAEGTVKSRCSRARARLAGLLADVLAPEERPAQAPPVPTAPQGEGNRAPQPHVSGVARRGPPAASAVD